MGSSCSSAPRSTTTTTGDAVRQMEGDPHSAFCSSCCPSGDDRECHSMEDGVAVNSPLRRRVVAGECCSLRTADSSASPSTVATDIPSRCSSDLSTVNPLVARSSVGTTVSVRSQEDIAPPLSQHFQIAEIDFLLSDTVTVTAESGVLGRGEHLIMITGRTSIPTPPLTHPRSIATPRDAADHRPPPIQLPRATMSPVAARTNPSEAIAHLFTHRHASSAILLPTRTDYSSDTEGTASTAPRHRMLHTFFPVTHARSAGCRFASASAARRRRTIRDQAEAPSVPHQTDHDAVAVNTSPLPRPANRVPSSPMVYHARVPPSHKRTNDD